MVDSWYGGVMPLPTAVPIVLTDDEREQLLAWSRRSSSAQALALRSRVVLACADTARCSNGRRNRWRRVRTMIPPSASDGRTTNAVVFSHAHSNAHGS